MKAKDMPVEKSAPLCLIPRCTGRIWAGSVKYCWNCDPDPNKQAKWLVNQPSFTIELRSRTTGEICYRSAAEVAAQVAAHKAFEEEYEVLDAIPDAELNSDKPMALDKLELSLGGSICGFCQINKATTPYLDPWKVLCDSCHDVLRTIKDSEYLVSLSERMDA